VARKKSALLCFIVVVIAGVLAVGILMLQPVTLPPEFLQFEAALDQMPIGELVVSAEEAMSIGETQIITAEVWLEDAVIVADELLRQASSATQTASLLVSPLMDAELLGSAFVIETGSSTRRQPFSPSYPAEWSWSVTAEDPGEHTLVLSVAAIVKLEGSEYSKKVADVEIPIRVRVPLGKRFTIFFDENLGWIKWLWAIAILPVGAALWKRLKKSRRPPPNSFTSTG